MRIVNRHYADVLTGYDRIAACQKQVDDARAQLQREIDAQYSRRLEEYQRLQAEWQRAAQSREDRYSQAFSAWLEAEKPGREAYQRSLALWQKRLEKAVRRADTRLLRPLERLHLYTVLLWVAVSLAVLATPACALLSLPYCLIPAPLFAFAAILLFFLRRALDKKVDALVERRNAIQSTPKPAYTPSSPEPPRVSPPPEPQRPRKTALPQSNLVQSWWDALQTPPASLHNEELQHHGLPGETRLVDELCRQLSDEFILVWGALVERNTDADVVVFGKNGIWVLDSKYFNGNVSYDENGWLHTKLVYRKGGRGIVDELPTDEEDPSGEWERERDSIAYTLKKKKKKGTPPIQGGIAFTYPGMGMAIDASYPVMTGTETFWSAKIGSTPGRPELSERDLVECLHHILNYSHQLENDNAASAVELAEALFVHQMNSLQTAH